MAALDAGFRLFSFETMRSPRLAHTLFYAGAVFVASGIHAFRQHHTTLNPVDPSSASTLVTSGMYCLSRNPMYLGFLLILAAFACLLGNWLAFACLPAFVLYMNRFQISLEERALSKKYGAAYSEYCATVRRWL